MKRDWLETLLWVPLVAVSVLAAIDTTGVAMGSMIVFAGIAAGSAALAAIRARNARRQLRTEAMRWLKTRADVGALIKDPQARFLNVTDRDALSSTNVQRYVVRSSVEGRRPPRRSVLERAESIFSGLSAIVPARIANEEIGDALEDVARRVREGRPQWEIRLKVVCTFGWVLFHTATYALERFKRALAGGAK